MNLEINKTYKIGGKTNSFTVTILDILNDNVRSHKMQYKEDTETRPITYLTDHDYFYFPGIYLSNLEIEEI